MMNGRQPALHSARAAGLRALLARLWLFLARFGLL
jgi:hypothetical protein